MLNDFDTDYFYALRKWDFLRMRSHEADVRISETWARRSRRLLAGCFGTLLAFLVVVTAPTPVQAQKQDVNAPSSPHVNLIVIDGGINPAVDDFIRESIDRAHESKAKALIIQHLSAINMAERC